MPCLLTTCCALSCILAYVLIKLLIIILSHCLHSSSMQLSAALRGHGTTEEQTQALAPVGGWCLEGSCSFCQPAEHQTSRPLHKCSYTSSGHHTVCLLLAGAEPQPSKQSGERATFQPQQRSASSSKASMLVCCEESQGKLLIKYQKDFVSLGKC